MLRELLQCRARTCGRVCVCVMLQGFVHGGPVLPPDMRRTWEWRRRGAVVLLVFGVFTGIVSEGPHMPMSTPDAHVDRQHYTALIW